jgi:hypothetical protein
MVKKSHPNREVVAVELSVPERRTLTRWHHELSVYSSATVILATTEVSDYVTQALDSLCSGLSKARAAVLENMVDEYLSNHPVVVPFQEAVREAEFRSRIIQTIPGYTAPEVADLVGSSAIGRRRLANKWRQERKVFAVPFNGRNIFLAFQFGPDGHPLQVIRAILERLDGLSDWDIAAWFVMTNSRLDNQRPLDVLEQSPDLVVEAASIDRHKVTRVR